MGERLGVLDDLWVVLSRHASDVLSALVRVQNKRYATDAGAAELGVPSRGMVAFLLGAGLHGVDPAEYSEQILKHADVAASHRSVERTFQLKVGGTRNFYVADLYAIADAARLPQREVDRLAHRVHGEYPVGSDHCVALLSIEHVVAALGSSSRVTQREGTTLRTRSIGFNRDRPIFAQFINPEFLRLHGQASLMTDPRACRQRLESVSRLAVLTSRSGLLLPASYLFEVPGVANFIKDTSVLRGTGAIQLTAPSQGLYDYREAKLAEYRDETSSNPYLNRDVIDIVGDVRWRPRLGRSAGQSIARTWARATRRGAALSGVVKTVADAERLNEPAARRRVARVPEMLQGRALISKYVFAALPRLRPSDQQAVRWLLSRTYLNSYIDDLDALMLVDFDFGSFASPGTSNREISASRLIKICRLLALDQDVPLDGTHWEVIAQLRETLELDILLGGLYDDNGSFDWWRSAATFRRRSAAPNLFSDVDGYVSWLGDLIASLPD